jgi:hypothetical protein
VDGFADELSAVVVLVFARATPLIIVETRIRIKKRHETFFTTPSTNFHPDGRQLAV